MFSSADPASIRLSASASACSRARIACASRARSTAAPSRCCAASDPSAAARTLARRASTCEPRIGDRGGCFRQRGGGNQGGDQRLALTLIVGEPRLQLAVAVGQLALLPFERGAARLPGRAGFDDLLQPGFGAGQRSDRGLELRCRLGARALGRLDAKLQPAPLVFEPQERGFRIGEVLRLTAQIRVDLAAAALRLVAGGDDARQFLLERFAGMTESLHGRCGLGLRHAQCRQRRFRFDAVPLLGERRLGRGGDGPLDLAQSRSDALRVGVRGMPARCKQQRLGLPDLLAEPAIALRLPSLLPQRLDLHRKRRDDIVDPREVCFGALQLQLGLVTAGMETGRCRRPRRGAGGARSAWRRSGRRPGPG